MTHTHTKQGLRSYNYISIDDKHTVVSHGEINLNNMTEGTIELNSSTGSLGTGDYSRSDDITSNNIVINQELNKGLGEIIKTIEKDDYIINVHQLGDNNVIMIKHPKTAGRPSFKNVINYE